MAFVAPGCGFVLRLSALGRSLLPGAVLLGALLSDAVLFDLLACAFCVRVLLSHRGVRSP